MPISVKSLVGVFLLQKMERKPPSSQCFHLREILKYISPDLLDLESESLYRIGMALNPTNKYLTSHVFNFPHINPFPKFEGQVLTRSLHPHDFPLN